MSISHDTELGLVSVFLYQVNFGDVLKFKKKPLEVIKELESSIFENLFLCEPEWKLFGSRDLSTTTEEPYPTVQNDL